MKNVLLIALLAAFVSVPASAKHSVKGRKLASDAICGSVTGDVESTENNTIIWNLYTQKDGNGFANDVLLETTPGDANSALLAIAMARVTIKGNDHTVNTETCVEVENRKPAKGTPTKVKSVRMWVSDSSH